MAAAYPELQVIEFMDAFTARPGRIVGNIALASLLAGVPLGILLSILGVLVGPSSTPVLKLLEEVGSGALLCPTVLFVIGMIVVAPIVAALRLVGYAGPFSVYAISGVLGLIAMSDDVRFGTIALMAGLATAYVFCRYAYRDAGDFSGVG